MKNKKIYITLIIVLCIIFMQACTQKPKNYIEVLDDHIVVNMDSSVSLRYKIHGEVTNIKFFIQQESIAKYLGGTIYGVSMGETKLFIEYDQGDMMTIPITVIDKVEYIIDLQDPEVNNSIYNEFKEELELFNDKVKNSNNISYSGYIKENYAKENFDLKLCKSPFYYEEKMNSQTMIITEENDKVFNYLIEGKTVERDFNCFKSNFNPNTYYFDKQIEILEIKFDPNVGNITRDGNKFTLVSHYKDAVRSDYEDTVESLFKQLGLSYSEFGKQVITREIIIEEDYFIFSWKFEMKIETKSQKISQELEVYEKLSIANFKKINIFDGGYKVLSPESNYEVLEETDISEEINLEAARNNVFLIEAKKGMLVIQDEKLNERSMDIKIYDINGELVSLPLSQYNSSCSAYLKSILVVPEDNKYYIHIRSNYNEDVKININNYQYSSLIDFEDNNIISGKTNYSSTIEGKYDFETFEYENESVDTKSIYMKNTGDTVIYYFNIRFNTHEGDEVKTLNPGENILINSPKGKNMIFICNDYKTTNEVDKYDFSIEIDIKNVSPMFESSYFEIDDIIDFKYDNLKYKYYIIYLEVGSYKMNLSNENIVVIKYNLNCTMEDSKDQNDTYKILNITEDNYYMFGFSEYSINDTIIVTRDMELN